MPNTSRSSSLRRVRIPYETAWMLPVTLDRLDVLDVRVGEYGATVRDRGIRKQTRSGRPLLLDGLRARVSRWPPLRLARMRCERESVGVVLPADGLGVSWLSTSVDRPSSSYTEKSPWSRPQGKVRLWSTDWTAQSVLMTTRRRRPDMTETETCARCGREVAKAHAIVVADTHERGELEVICPGCLTEEEVPRAYGSILESDE